MSAQTFIQLRQDLAKQIIGQEDLVKKLVIALVCDGHLLVEGAPGLAKTRAINALSDAIEGDFHRIQFTPDLLPGDLTGSDIFRPQTGEFTFQKGPLFHNLVLADEVNRAPAKVQAALLEAMAERQITVGQTTYKLPDLFLVMATQNPIDQEGTYSLPEAQMDRFLMQVNVDYPSLESERSILKLTRKEAQSDAEKPEVVVTEGQIMLARKEVLKVNMADNVENYLLELIGLTRDTSRYLQNEGKLLAFGASPRGTIALDRVARANAWLDGRDFVTPADIQSVVPDVLRHRIMLSYEAEARGLSTDDVIAMMISVLPAP